jgi:hypothetical protein
MAAAITPTDADVLSTKEAILALLQDGRTREAVPMIIGVLEQFGVPAEQHGEAYDLPDDASPIDRDTLPIKRIRLRSAVKIALAQLTAQGMVVRGDGGGNDYETLSIRWPSGAGGERFALSIPSIDEGYRLTPGRLSEPVDDFRLLDPAIFLDGLDELVDERGRRCTGEALASARRGLWLSGVNMLGAVSEGVWFTIGEAMRDRNSELAGGLDAARTAQVIRLVANELEALLPRGRRTDLTDVRAHAAYLRDLRNYGIHPRAERNHSLEHAFTETGCLLLILKTHRYLTRLADLVSAAGVDLSTGGVAAPG